MVESETRPKERTAGKEDSPAREGEKKGTYIEGKRGYRKREGKGR